LELLPVQALLVQVPIHRAVARYRGPALQRGVVRDAWAAAVVVVAPAFVVAALAVEGVVDPADPAVEAGIPGAEGPGWTFA
jgi:hypothetical protein